MRPFCYLKELFSNQVNLIPACTSLVRTIGWAFPATHEFTLELSVADIVRVSLTLDGIGEPVE
jgi:hypothetical protein